MERNVELIDGELIAKSKAYMSRHSVDGWLIYGYRQSNPFLPNIVGNTSMVTRPVFFFIPANGDPTLLVHHVDIGRFSDLICDKLDYTSHQSLLDQLSALVTGCMRIAMEYSPMAMLPRISVVDGGTMDMIRSLGVEIISSEDIAQHAMQQWNAEQLESHKDAANKLSMIVKESFDYVGSRLGIGVSELDVMQFIQERFQEENLLAYDGPVVAVDAHSSDPHYLPDRDKSLTIQQGSWILIDMWAKGFGNRDMFADITWVGYVGKHLPTRYQDAFNLVILARDTALAFLQECCIKGEYPQGWQVDSIARDLIMKWGYGPYFTHRLGHSLGSDVHGEAVNLDGFETYDTRTLTPNIGVTIEPGLYMKDFGMRSEIDVFVAESGVIVTTDVQREVVLIN